MVDKDVLQDFLEHIADHYHGYEVVEILEDAGLIDVWAVLAAFEEQIMEARSKFES